MLFAKSTNGFYSISIHAPEQIPTDAVEISDKDYALLLEGQASGKQIAADEKGRPFLQTPPPPTVAEIIATYTGAIQKRLDDFARTRNYDGILSAATYATSVVPKFKAEGQYAVEARDATWAKGYEILAAVEAGTRPLPTLEALAAELPALAWPK